MTPYEETLRKDLCTKAPTECLFIIQGKLNNLKGEAEEYPAFLWLDICINICEKLSKELIETGKIAPPNN